MSWQRSIIADKLPSDMEPEELEKLERLICRVDAQFKILIGLWVLILLVILLKGLL